MRERVPRTENIEVISDVNRKAYRRQLHRLVRWFVRLASDVARCENACRSLRVEIRQRPVQVIHDGGLRKDDVVAAVAIPALSVHRAKAGELPTYTSTNTTAMITERFTAGKGRCRRAS